MRQSVRTVSALHNHSCHAGYPGAHRHNVDEWLYLKDVLERLGRGDTDYESMLADRWKAVHPEAVRTFREEERRNRADIKRTKRAIRRAQGGRAPPRANR